jgi:diaminopimelate epimerase
MKMLQKDTKFFKYQSLGNDFILFDMRANLSLNTMSNVWAEIVVELCRRSFGIGADGVLVLVEKCGLVKCLIFNADGSEAEMCLNGAKCVAQHLYRHNNIKAVDFMMGEVLLSSNISLGFAEKTNTVELFLPKPKYLNMQSIEIGQAMICRHIVNAENPHYVIFANDNGIYDVAAMQCWLDDYGNQIEEHANFPNRTNVELLLKQEETDFDSTTCYHMLVHERGCGQTMACGSGAAAAFQVLRQISQINDERQVKITMPGGCLLMKYLGDCVVQNAQSSAVFTGYYSISNNYIQY